MCHSLAWLDSNHTTFTSLSILSCGVLIIATSHSDPSSQGQHSSTSQHLYHPRSHHEDHKSLCPLWNTVLPTEGKRPPLHIPTTNHQIYNHPGQRKPSSIRRPPTTLLKSVELPSPPGTIPPMALSRPATGS